MTDIVPLKEKNCYGRIEDELGEIRQDIYLWEDIKKAVEGLKKDIKDNYGKNGFIHQQDVLDLIDARVGK
jgi:hypothetical protein